MIARTMPLGTTARARAIRALRIAPLLAALATIGSLPGQTVAETGEAALPAVPANGELGFIIGWMEPARYRVKKEDCPEGYAGTIYDNYLLSLAPEQRARLGQKDKEGEMRAGAQRYAAGPGNTNICSHPDKFNRPPQPMMKGTIGAGMNLDGAGDDSSSDYTCAHKNFTSPAGEQGIDNQTWRAMGCTEQERVAGTEIADGVRAKTVSPTILSGEMAQVLLIRGIDSFAKDDNVEVIYANTGDRPLASVAGSLLTNASYNVTDNALHRNVLKGRILNGVLTTEPQRIQLRKGFGQVVGMDLGAERAGFDIDRGRLRLTFNRDGSIQGLVGGYEPVQSAIRYLAIGGIASVFFTGIDCAAAYSALKQMADGGRDPKTGQCTRISNGYEIEGVPAYVNDRSAVRKIARK